VLFDFLINVAASWVAGQNYLLILNTHTNRWFKQGRLESAH